MWCKYLHISTIFRNFAAEFENQLNFRDMDNEEFLQRLLILAENQDKHICELEKLVQAQQRTIDTLTDMAQPIVNNFGCKYNTAQSITEGAQVQNFNTK